MSDVPADDDENGFGDHWVRVMADFSSDGVWYSDGCAGSPEDLPISDQLRADILAWAEWYDRDCDDGMPDPRPFPRAEFSAHGLGLARRLKAELPDWTVIYHDTEKAWARPCDADWSVFDRDADRSVFEYEILLEAPNDGEARGGS